MGLVFLVVAVCITIYFAKKELDREIRAELEAENAKLAVGRGSENDSPSSTTASQGSYTKSQRELLEGHAIEVQYSGYDGEGVDDEEWFWFYA